MRILIVEDAEDMAEALAISFARRGDAVDRTGTLGDAVAHLDAQDYDLMILDIELPDGSGHDALRHLRQSGKATPVLMLTARSEVDERVAALDGGADDYLTKPFDLRELQARVRSLTRRAQGQAHGAKTIGPLSLDVARQTVTLSGRPLALTRRELSLLDSLLAHDGWVVSKERIFQRMFGFDDDEVGLNAVEIHVTRLRKKLEGSGVVIRTLRGIGYQLALDG